MAVYVYRKVAAKIPMTSKTSNQLQLEQCSKELLQEEGESATSATANMCTLHCMIAAVNMKGTVHGV